MQNIEKLKYPIGTFKIPENISKEDITLWITQLKSFPERLKQAVLPLSDKQLDTPYRPGGWTIRQVIHHLADTHMNIFMRVKLALTEDHPIIKPFQQDAWVELSDSLYYPIEPSLKILEGIHERLAYLFENLTEDDLKKKFTHPGYNKVFTIEQVIGLFTWHGNHHLAHITNSINL